MKTFFKFFAPKTLAQVDAEIAEMQRKITDKKRRSVMDATKPLCIKNAEV